jgi:peptidoglycan/LPS O-acetylase OafA/YrhL
MKYIRALDGVRALAIILVMLFHFYFLIEVGWIGVQLFFVLSGYLITSILLDSKSDDLGGYLKRFYWRRSLRIFPLYYAYLLLIAILYVAAHVPQDFMSKILYLIFYNYNHYPLFHSLAHDVTFTHFWSLSVEEQFYLFWPFVIFFLSRSQLRYLLTAIILIVPAFRFFMFDWLVARQYPMEDIGQIIYRMTASQIDGFAFGAAITVFKLNERPKIAFPLLWVSIILFLLLGFWNYQHTQGPLSSLGYPIGGVTNYQHVWSYTIINFLSVSLILVVISQYKSRVVKWIFENDFMVSIGKVSYGMYVYHWAFLAFYRKAIHYHIGDRLISFLIYFFLTFVISWLSFRFFESHFIRLKDRYTGRLNRANAQDR